MKTKHRLLRRLYYISTALSGLIWLCFTFARISIIGVGIIYPLVAIAIAILAVGLLWFIGFYVEKYVLKLRYMEYYINRLAKYDCIDPFVYLQNREHKRNTIYCNDDMLWLAIFVRNDDTTFSDHVGDFMPLTLDKTLFKIIMGEPNHLSKEDDGSEIWEFYCKNGNITVKVNGENPENYSNFIAFFKLESAVKIRKTRYERLEERKESTKRLNNSGEKVSEIV